MLRDRQNSNDACRKCNGKPTLSDRLSFLGLLVLIVSRIRNSLHQLIIIILLIRSNNRISTYKFAYAIPGYLYRPSIALLFVPTPPSSASPMKPPTISPAFPPSLLNYLPTKHKRRWTPTVIQFRSVEAKPEDSDRRSNAQTYTSLNGFGTFLVSAFDQSYTICVVKQTLSVQGGPEGTELSKVITKEKKFESRAAAWLRILILEHTTFNGALPLDCMSSEESDHEADSSQLETTYGEAAVSYDSFTLLIRRIQVVPKRGWTKMNRAIGTYWPPTEWSFELDDKSALDSCYGG
ncbi:hypothetical protein F5880DRAFT_1673464 [Lentinula raphanica]|nr:hypothetical protein F5880DRAFT_1673464 [Lentinula raphanica]